MDSLDNKYRADLYEIYVKTNKMIWDCIKRLKVGSLQEQMFFNIAFVKMQNVLSNTFRKENKKTYIEKIKYNNKILRSPSFRKLLVLRSCYINPIIFKCYKTGRYELVIIFQKIAKIKKLFIKRKS